MMSIELYRRFTLQESSTRDQLLTIKIYNPECVNCFTVAFQPFWEPRFLYFEEVLGKRYKHCKTILRIFQYISINLQIFVQYKRIIYISQI